MKNQETTKEEPANELEVLLPAVADREAIEAHRVRTEQALRESEEKYRLMVEEINDVIYTADTNKIITYMSPVIEPLSGYSVSELVGRRFTEFVHPDVQAVLSKRFS